MAKRWGKKMLNHSGAQHLIAKYRSSRSTSSVMTQLLQLADTHCTRRRIACQIGRDLAVTLVVGGGSTQDWLQETDFDIQLKQLMDHSAYD